MQYTPPLEGSMPCLTPSFANCLQSSHCIQDMDIFRTKVLNELIAYHIWQVSLIRSLQLTLFPQCIFMVKKGNLSQHSFIFCQTGSIHEYFKT